MEIIYDLNKITVTARDLIKLLKHRVVLFEGGMGYGKTTLISALVKELGSYDVVTSPTFGLVNEYKRAKLNIYHFDFYRIENIQEAIDIGVEEYFNSGSWCFVEWSEKIKELITEPYSQVNISVLGEVKRSLVLENHPDKYVVR